MISVVSVQIQSVEVSDEDVGCRRGDRRVAFARLASCYHDHIVARFNLAVATRAERRLVPGSGAAPSTPPGGSAGKRNTSPRIEPLSCPIGGRTQSGLQCAGAFAKTIVLATPHHQEHAEVG